MLNSMASDNVGDGHLFNSIASAASAGRHDGTMTSKKVIEILQKDDEVPADATIVPS